VRTGVLLAIIGVLRVARTARTYPRPALSLAGTAVTVAGLTLPSWAVLVAGFLVLFLAMFLPSDPPAKPSSARLWAEPLIPWAPSTRHRPPYR
jgi:Na+/H+-translocating membrane pyrophosphatase